MSNQVREIQLGLLLDPELESDRQALAELKRWYQRAKIINSDHDSFDFFKLRLHKNIYLSGLFLCLLEPNLVKFLAQHLNEENLSVEFLHQALTEHRLMPERHEEPEALENSVPPLAPDELANRIAAQLSPLLNAQGETAGLSEQNSQLQAQVGMLAERLQEQNQLLQQQSQMLDSLTRIGSQVSSSPGRGSSPTAQPSEEVQLHDLSATAAKVRKVRAKGVF